LQAAGEEVLPHTPRILPARWVEEVMPRSRRGSLTAAVLEGVKS